MRNWNDDPYTKKARKEHYLARSLYKLEDIEAKEKILFSAKLILDLGAAPGSWAQYCLKHAPQARILAADISPLKIVNPRIEFINSSVFDIDFAPILNGAKIDVLLSDMAPNTSGIADRDSALSYELCKRALEIAQGHLHFRGCMITKIFMGDLFETFHKEMKDAFEYVKLYRPESIRKQSKEIFMVGRHLRRPLPSDETP